MDAELTVDLFPDPPVDDEADGRSRLFTNSKSSNVGCSVSNRSLNPENFYSYNGGASRNK